MAKFAFVKGTTSQTVLIFIQDSSSSTGAGLTGLTSASSGLTAYYYREGAGTGATQITLAATGSLGTWESGGFFEVDATDMPGWYEVGLPNAALASGADFVGVQLKGATNMAPCNLEIQLTGVDLNDATDGGIASVADWTDGGRLDLLLDAVKAKTDSLTFTVAGKADANVTHWGGTANPTPDAAGYPKVTIKTGTGTGEANITAGVVQADVTKWLTATPAALANTDKVAVSVQHWSLAGITTNITGSLSGSVGSVTTKTGYSLASTGLDLITIDGKTLPVAMHHIAAGTAGEISGAGTGTEVIKGLDGTTTRMTATVDSSGNRTAITYTDP